MESETLNIYEKSPEFLKGAAEVESLRSSYLRDLDKLRKKYAVKFMKVAAATDHNSPCSIPK